MASSPYGRRLLVSILFLVVGSLVAFAMHRVIVGARSTIVIGEREVASEELLYPDREWIHHFPESTLQRFSLRESEARLILPQLAHEWNRFDPLMYFGYRPNLDVEMGFAEHPEGKYRIVTNSLGMRRDGEPATEKPPFRVLVAGDSHADGVCHNREAFAAVAEEHLEATRTGVEVEVLNASRGGQFPYGYLGTFERFVDLDPDVFVVWFTGSNDFIDPLFLGRAFRGERSVGLSVEQEKLRKLARRDDLALYSAGIHSAFYFHHEPGQADFSLGLCRDILLEITLLGASHGTEVLLVYLPAPVFMDWENPKPVLTKMLATLEVDFETLATQSRDMGRRLEEICVELEMPFFDLGQALTGDVDRSFYQIDLHLNPHGQDQVGRALARELEPAFERAAE